MRIANSYEARKALASAVGMIHAASEELKNEMSKNQKFRIAWTLAFQDLQMLENFRIPSDSEPDKIWDGEEWVDREEKT